MTVATRELKNRLSHYLRLVDEGVTIHVTSRGRVVAEIKPARHTRSRDEEIWRRLEAEGLVTCGTGEYMDFEPIKLRRGTKPTSQIIIEDRD